MPQTFNPRATALPLLLLPVLLAGCANVSPLFKPQPSLQIPPLPSAARQPSKPEMCSPTCSDALTKERESWLRMLTPPEQPAKPAKPATAV